MYRATICLFGKKKNFFFPCQLNVFFFIDYCSGEMKFSIIDENVVFFFGYSKW